MFGLLISGRLVDTSFRPVDDRHCVIDVPDANSINHIVVFLTGQQPFPGVSGGAVYFSWPDQQQVMADSWQYLGMISNAKPSAIFRVGKLRAQGCVEQSMSANFGQQVSNVADKSTTAQVGISVESLDTLQGLQQATMESEASMVPKFVDFTQKMVSSLFNYTTSFAVGADEARTKSPSETYVPCSAVNQWYDNFERRLRSNPYFWTKP